MDHQNAILYRLDGAVARVSFNRPAQLNPLIVPEGVDDLAAACDRAVSDGARAVLLTGEGRGFCSGADLKNLDIDQFTGNIQSWLAEILNPLFERIHALPLPLVVAVNGPAVGAGCSLALYGDMVVAARSAYFYQSFVDIGLHPDAGATWLLPRLVGLQRAARMMMMGERIDAATAAQWGMIHEVVDDTVLQARAMEIARQLAAKPTRALALIRQAVRDGAASTFAEALAVEARNQGAAAQTQDFRIGVHAFREKRRPSFTGT